MQNIIVNLLLICALIVMAEIVAYTKLIPPRVLRKIMHIATGGVVILGSYMTDYKSYVIVGILMIGALVAARYVLPLRSLQDRFYESHGEIYFAAGVAVAALLCPSLIGFVACVATLALADTAAYIMGSYVNSAVIYRGKTLAGSVACFLVAGLVFISAGYSWGESILIGLFITGAEILGTRGSDNMSMPVVGAILLKFFR